MSNGQNCCTVLQRDAKYLRLTYGCQAQLVAKCRCALIARRVTFLSASVEESDNLVAIILHGRNRAIGVAAQVPPLIRVDAVPICIGAGTECGVARRGLG